MKKLSLVIILLMVGLVIAGLGIGSVSVSPDSIKPGTTGTLTFTVSNTAEVSGIGKTASGVYVGFTPTSQITITNDLQIGKMVSGSSTSISVPFSIKGDAQSGSYIIKIMTRAQEFEPVYATATVNVVNEPILTLSSDKQDISEIDTVQLTILNSGGEARNLRITPAGDFSLVGANELFVGTVAGSATVPVQLDGRNADDGVNDITFMLNYEDELGNAKTKEVSLRFTLKKEELGLIFQQDSEVITNRDSILKLKITNSGEKTLSNLKMTFESDNIKPRETSEIKIGTLEGGQSTEIPIPVFATLAPGINNVQLDLEWTEDSQTKTDSIIFPMTITSDAEIGIYLEAKPTPLYAGQEHTLSVLVSNLGSYSIENVDVSIESDAYDLLELQETEYIGGLEQDDFSTVQFKIRAREAGTYPITIKVNYRDQSGEWKHMESDQEIVVRQFSAGGGPGLEVLVVLVAIAAVLYWYFKRRKAEKK